MLGIGVNGHVYRYASANIGRLINQHGKPTIFKVGKKSSVEAVGTQGIYHSKEKSEGHQRLDVREKITPVADTLVYLLKEFHIVCAQETGPEQASALKEEMKRLIRENQSDARELEVGTTCRKEDVPEIDIDFRSWSQEEDIIDEEKRTGKSPGGLTIFINKNRWRFDETYGENGQAILRVPKAGIQKIKFNRRNKGLRDDQTKSSYSQDFGDEPVFALQIAKLKAPGSTHTFKIANWHTVLTRRKPWTLAQSKINSYREARKNVVIGAMSIAAEEGALLFAGDSNLSYEDIYTSRQLKGCYEDIKRDLGLNGEPVWNFMTAESDLTNIGVSFKINNCKCLLDFPIVGGDGHSIAGFEVIKINRTNWSKTSKGRVYNGPKIHKREFGAEHSKLGPSERQKAFEDRQQELRNKEIEIKKRAEEWREKQIRKRKDESRDDYHGDRRRRYESRDDYPDNSRGKYKSRDDYPNSQKHHQYRGGYESGESWDSEEEQLFIQEDCPSSSQQEDQYQEFTYDSRDESDHKKRRQTYHSDTSTHQYERNLQLEEYVRSTGSDQPQTNRVVYITQERQASPIPLPSSQLWNNMSSNRQVSRGDEVREKVVLSTSNRKIYLDERKYIDEQVNTTWPHKKPRSPTQNSPREKEKLKSKDSLQEKNKPNIHTIQKPDGSMFSFSLGATGPSRFKKPETKRVVEVEEIKDSSSEKEISFKPKAPKQGGTENRKKPKHPEQGVDQEESESSEKEKEEKHKGQRKHPERIEAKDKESSSSEDESNAAAAAERRKEINEIDELPRKEQREQREIDDIDRLTPDPPLEIVHRAEDTLVWGSNEEDLEDLRAGAQRVERRANYPERYTKEATEEPTTRPEDDLEEVALGTHEWENPNMQENRHYAGKDRFDKWKPIHDESRRGHQQHFNSGV